MDFAVAVSITYEQATVWGNCQIGGFVERHPRRTRNSWGTQSPLQFSRRVEFMDAVGQSLGTVNLIGLINVDAVGVLQDVVAPGRQEVSLVVKDHHGVITTAVHVHTILTVDRDSGDPTEGPASGDCLLYTSDAADE